MRKDSLNSFILYDLCKIRKYMSHISCGCYQSADQQTVELSEPHNFYKKLCVWSVIWRTISFILIRICVSLINIFFVTQRSLKFSHNSSHDSLFTSECKQSKRFKIVLGLYIKSISFCSSMFRMNSKRNFKMKIRVLKVSSDWKNWSWSRRYLCCNATVLEVFY